MSGNTSNGLTVLFIFVAFMLGLTQHTKTQKKNKKLLMLFQKLIQICYYGSVKALIGHWTDVSIMLSVRATILIKLKPILSKC